jgi:hypothetical protein
MMLNQIDPILGLKKTFVEKDKVEHVSRLTLGGQQGNTAITYRSKKGKLVMISVIEDPKYIMNKIAY